jgi:hypothetical protein
MRRILICSGVLGGGTAIVFALAALTATLFPGGTVLGTGWNGPWLDLRAGWGGVPIPAPIMLEAPAVDPEFSVSEKVAPLPGDRTLEWSVDGEWGTQAP